MQRPEHRQARVAHTEAIAEQDIGVRPPSTPLQHQLFNAEPAPSARPSWQHNNDENVIAGQAPPASKLCRNRERLEGCLLQCTAYFTIPSIRDER